MIQVEDLSYTYPPILPGGERVIALDKLSFAVPAGTCLAITGPNGCGKTSLCLAVAGLAPRLTGGRLEGRIWVGGRDVQAEPLGTLADLIGVVMQDPSGQLFMPTVEDEIGWGLENLGIPPDEMEARIERSLIDVGLDHIPRKQSPHTLSGGEQKRLALAAALALHPRVLILDEPAGGLAPAARHQMIAVLQRLRAEHNLSILLAENDPMVIVELADEVLVLEGGHIVGGAKPEVFYLSLESERPPGISVPPASRFAAAVNVSGKFHLTCLTLERALEEVKSYPLNGSKAGIPTAPACQPSLDVVQPAFELHNLHFSYAPERPILDGIDLTVASGQFVALTGDNGAGKTTLAKHLIGLLRPTAGRVLLFGSDTSKLSIGQLAQKVGFSFQSPELQIFSATVWEEIAFGPRNLGLGDAGLEAAVEEALRNFNLLALADYPPAMLSFSTRRMVAMASIAAMKTPTLVLDEPTVGLDAEGQTKVMQWLAERHRQGTTILLITHDMELVAAYTQRLLVLKDGVIKADGEPEQVFTQSALLEEAGLAPPFAAKFAKALDQPTLAADLTPEGAAHAWLELVQ